MSPLAEFTCITLLAECKFMGRFRVRVLEAAAPSLKQPRVNSLDKLCLIATVTLIKVTDALIRPVRCFTVNQLGYGHTN